MRLPQTPSNRLDGQRALVTGAGGGLGLAAATALARAGAEVTLAGRTGGKLDAAVTALKDEGLAAQPMVLDVTDTRQVRQTIAGLPAFSVLVNNAGTNVPAPFTDVRAEDFDRMMLLNVRAAFFVALAVSQKMIRDKIPGSVINISSQMGHVGGRNRSVYCATKHAMEGWTKAAALDLAPYNIRVNTICPTFVRTPLTEGMLKDANFAEDVLSKIALGRGFPGDRQCLKSRRRLDGSIRMPCQKLLSGGSAKPPTIRYVRGGGLPGDRQCLALSALLKSGRRPDGSTRRI